MSRSAKQEYPFRNIDNAEVRVEDGGTYVTAQLTEEQMKGLKRNFIEDYSINTERIIWQPGQGFVIEEHPGEPE